MVLNDEAVRYLTERDASQITGLSVAWFQRARWAGNGPPYVKLGHAVRYKHADLLAWMDARTVRSTTHADAMGVLGK